MMKACGCCEEGQVRKQTSAQIAAAQAAAGKSSSKANDKKKKDKSHYNQMPG